MSTRIRVTDDVIAVYNDMKVRKTQATDEEKRLIKKAVMFCLSNKKGRITIIIDEGKEILLGDIGTKVMDPYQHFLEMLPVDDCRYALYDATFETTLGKKEELVFIFWVPESAPLKSKMMYATSVYAIQKEFTGLKHVWQVNGLEDIKDRNTLADKLGGSDVVSLEGSPIIQ